MSAAVEGPDPAAGLHVTAVLVSHDGARWLPQVLDALERQRRLPDALVAVDTGSTDGSADLLAARIGGRDVCRVDRSTGFGDAVVVGLEHVDRQQPPSPHRRVRVPTANPVDRSRAWVWLLHDDSAPAPEALACLLDQVRGDVAVVGPKIREWPSLRRLLEVGATLSSTGHRETGLERGEPDQGQHDRPRDVLAVNTAGMLVRRDVWDHLDGLDPYLPLFGDDLDFGWRVARAGYRTRTAPEAVVFHLEAATRGLRTAGAYAGPAVAERRRAALFTLLANATRPGFWWQSVRLLLGSVLRIAGLLLAKAPREAMAELRGLGSVYLSPIAMLRARHRRHGEATRSTREIRQLLPSPLLPYRHGLDAVLDIGLAVVRAAGGGGQQPQPSGKRAVVAESGPVMAEAEDLPTTTSALWRLVRQPWTLVVLVLLALSVWSARGLLGSGQLAGGALLPAPDGVGDWWRLLWEPWHPVGVGSDASAGPYVVVLAFGGLVTFGQPWLLVDLLVLAAAPLCALTASRLARRIFDSRRVRVWWSATYAVLPVLTGALAQGRIGTLVGLIVAPLVASATLDLVTNSGSVRLPTLRLSLWLSLLVAFVPVAYAMTLLAVTLAILGRPVGARGRARSLLPVVGVAVVPWLLLGSWMWDRAVDPAAVWWEAGLATARTDGRPIELAPGALDLAGGVPGGLGSAPAWLGLVVVLLGLFALGRTDRPREVGACWTVALIGLGFAVLGAGQRVDVGLVTAAPVWVGFPLACWLAGLAAAAGLAADRVGDFLAGRSFGWRQPVAVGGSVVALAVPVAVAGWWVFDDTALDRTDPVPVPMYLEARASGPEQSATLVLTGSPAAGVGYEIVRDDGTRLGDETVLPDGPDVAAMDRGVAAVLSHPDAQAVGFLVDHGIGAIYALPPVDGTVESALDGADGLTRAGTTDPAARAWETDSPGGAVRLISGKPGKPKAEVLDAPPSLNGDVELPAAAAGGELRIAAVASDRWAAVGSDSELDGVTTSSGTQAFATSGGGRVTLSFASHHSSWILARLIVVLVAIVAALPGGRRRT